MSIASINEFLTLGLNRNGARPSRFNCSVSNLAGVGNLQYFRFMCKAATVPTFTVGIAEASYFGRKLKFSGDRTWDEWTCSIYLDADYDIRNQMENWSNGINATEDNTMANAYLFNKYKATVDINHYGQDSNDTVIAHYQLTGVWPTRVGEIRLAWEAQNQIAEFDVTFAFDNCTRGSRSFEDLANGKVTKQTN